jgi:hypothetical protein
MCQGLVPQLWKEGNITALFKKGDKAEPGNYRPGSIVNTLLKKLARTSAFSLSVVVFLSSPSSVLNFSSDIPVLVFLFKK